MYVYGLVKCSSDVENILRAPSADNNNANGSVDLVGISSASYFKSSWHENCQCSMQSRNTEKLQQIYPHQMFMELGSELIWISMCDKYSAMQICCLLIEMRCLRIRIEYYNSAYQNIFLNLIKMGIFGHEMHRNSLTAARHCKRRHNNLCRFSYLLDIFNNDKWINKFTNLPQHQYNRELLISPFQQDHKIWHND